MERSKKVMFVSHSLLNQNVMPVGTEKYAGMVKDLVEMLAEAGIGIIQLPDPEFEFNGGIISKAKTKEQLDKKDFRKYCRDLSKQVLIQIEKYKAKNYFVLGILGVEFSPTLAVHQLANGHKVAPGKGILIEELEEEMRKKNFQVPILGFNLNNVFSSLEKVQSLLKYA
jgi:predicted secreted protein